MGHLNVSKLILEREEARAEKDWARADTLRSQIAVLGFDLTDLPDGKSVATRNAIWDGRRRVICHICGTEFRTYHPTEEECWDCRYKVKNVR